MKDASPEPRGRGMAEGMLEGMVEGGVGEGFKGGDLVDLWVIKNKMIRNLVSPSCQFYLSTIHCK